MFVTRLFRSRFSVILKFTKEHEWVKFDSASQIAKVGITDHAQQELGDIVHIELPKLGLAFRQHQSVGAIESVKVAADLYAPVGGEVIGINEDLKDSPNLVNEDADGAWIFQARVSDPKELDQLLDKQAYLDLIKQSH